MNILSKLFSSTTGGIIKEIGDVVDQFNLSGEEREQFKLEAQKLLQSRLSELEETLRTEIRAKQAIIVAEMQQGDTFTKRARPSVVYFGLAIIGVDYLTRALSYLFASIPVIQVSLVPQEFWMTWGGVVGTWIIGRSAEKRGVTGLTAKAAGFVTGSRNKLLEDL